MPTTSRSSRPSPSVSIETASRSDYTAMSGTLTFTVGQREKTVRVPILDDSHDDDGETFALVLSNASGARIGDGGAVGTP